jgi:hypothetical protein
MKLSELLAMRRISLPQTRLKYVRHLQPGIDIEEIARTGWIETYQQYQGSPVFDGCDAIVSFVGEPRQARFLGIYDVLGRMSAKSVPSPPALPRQDWLAGARYWYDLRLREDLADLRHRLVVRWAARGFHLWPTDFDITEIRPEGRRLPPFRDFGTVHLTFTQLSELAKNAAAHTDWIAGLSAVGGVYLIVSAATGEQYVGSATGSGGIWQRWTSYLRDGHAGNARLRALVEADPRHPVAFSFSVLDTFSRGLSKAEALLREVRYKAKLGTRAFGLNAN